MQANVPPPPCFVSGVFAGRPFYFPFPQGHEVWSQAREMFYPLPDGACFARTMRNRTADACRSISSECNSDTE